MKLLTFSFLIVFAFCLCEARKECLTVRGHVKCGHQRQLSGGSSDWDRGSRGRGHGSGRGSGGHGSDVITASGYGGGSSRSSNPVFIKLIDEDTGGPDDWMDETYASSTGAFQLHGCATDGPFGGHIEPMLRIYHKCKGTPKRFTVEIPVQFIDKEYNVSTVFDLQGPLQNEVNDRYPVPQCGGRRGKFYLF